MAVERPVILITPKDFHVDDEDIQALAKAIFQAQPGQVISAGFAVQIHHLIDGLWIEARDLHKVLKKAGDDGYDGDPGYEFIDPIHAG